MDDHGTDHVLVVVGYEFDDEPGVLPVTLHVIPSAVRRAALAMAFPAAYVDAYAKFCVRSVLGILTTLEARREHVERVRRYYMRHMHLGDWPPIRWPALPQVTAADLYARAALEFVPWWFVEESVYLIH